MFSDNETLDEVTSNELRYFLCDALLGWLYTQSFDLQKRLQNLEQAQKYFTKFLKITREYEFHNFTIKSESLLDNFVNKHGNEAASNASLSRQVALDNDLIKGAYERSEKIKRFREQKELEKKLEAMRSVRISTNIDDEHKRELYMSYIKFWVNKCIEDFKLLIDEMMMLKNMDQLKLNEDERKKEAKDKAVAPKAPPKPYIITRDEVQAKVFGMGYPSTPVYSIDQFYDQLTCCGYMPKPGEEYQPVQVGGGVTDSQKEDDRVKQERLEDANDEEELQRQRDWDEWKDDNKRGEGNRYNRS